MVQKQDLIDVLIRFDRKNKEKNEKNPKFYYNHYALGIYLTRLDDVWEKYERGIHNLRDLLIDGFHDPILKLLTKKLDEV